MKLQEEFESLGRCQLQMFSQQCAVDIFLALLNKSHSVRGSQRDYICVSNHCP